MRKSIALIFIAVGLLCLPAPAELTMQQRIDDFRSLVALYDKQYAPYQWKYQLFGFDALDMRPWLDRIQRTKDDLDYYEVLAEYVASLQDSHDRYLLPSTFAAVLGFTVDLYDGKVLVDSINRQMLRESDYPFQVGDELVSLDGRAPEEWMEIQSKYIGSGNPHARRRIAAAGITQRVQQRWPRAHEVGESATVVLRRLSGELQTYTVPWTKSGRPLTSQGPVPDPRAAAGARAVAPAVVWDVPDYLLPLMELQNVSMADGGPTVLRASAVTPPFAPPPDFRPRMGASRTDNFVSGTLEAEGLRIGFIRIPTFSPLPVTAPGVLIFTQDLTFALRQFETEIAYLEQNTDGLVIDVTGNPGGFVIYVEELLARVIPHTFRTLGFEVRVSWQRLDSFYLALESARRQNAPAWVIALLEAIVRDLETAYQENRGRTGPLPLGNSLSLDLPPARVAYTKPLIVLVDEFSGSGADMFPAVIQDNRRGLIVGMRTAGAGGSVANFTVGAYSEGATRVTLSLMNRKEPIVTPEYPAAPYVENIGVRPDIALDMMTRENLLNGGKDYIERVRAIVADHIRKSRQ